MCQSVQGSSTDIICSCIIIQATASPQGSPAETWSRSRSLPASIYLFPSLSLPSFLSPSQGCRLWPSVTPVIDDFEHDVRLAARLTIFCGFGILFFFPLRSPLNWFCWNDPSVTRTQFAAMKINVSDNQERKMERKGGGDE